MAVVITAHTTKRMHTAMNMARWMCLGSGGPPRRWWSPTRRPSRGRSPAPPTRRTSAPERWWSGSTGCAAACPTAPGPPPTRPGWPPGRPRWPRPGPSRPPCTPRRFDATATAEQGQRPHRGQPAADVEHVGQCGADDEGVGRHHQHDGAQVREGDRQGHPVVHGPRHVAADGRRRREHAVQLAEERPGQQGQHPGHPDGDPGRVPGHVGDQSGGRQVLQGGEGQPGGGGRPPCAGPWPGGGWRPGRCRRWSRRRGHWSRKATIDMASSRMHVLGGRRPGRSRR